eukprot:CAMPEP_0201517848 /NCGR_PEP_ID=MMETSP0161_2-20130828/8851_1 /ASSEMBLY_ACC=CAM_ASM_000251 /TAXON_ID=180227 /ORGANISM="Neoparamoeba aestuarina, Strain SoJaBio B1-5/56/2" /LENGTH=191 /DNA_ID=CAMNT_0047915475 /DNA_START=41 /DNA_END=616 /DNA_ORIENTATION=+
MFNFLVSVITSDPSLGKVDKSSMSEQTLMELFAEGITDNRSALSISRQEPQDIYDWKGLNFDSSGAVTGIGWILQKLGGSIRLEWLPASVKYVFVDRNRLSGTVCLTQLPHVLQTLLMTSNLFSGTVDLTQLPKELVRLRLNDNAFHGETDFIQLPPQLRDLRVDHTQLSGEIYHFDGTLGVDDSNVKDMR